MSDPWNWCNPPSVPSLGEGCPPCQTADTLLTTKYQPDSAHGWGLGPSRCLFRLISALWQRYHVLGLTKPDFVEDGFSFKAGSEPFLKAVSVRNAYNAVLAQIHQGILEVGIRFNNLDGTQVSRQDLLGWGVKETGHHYPVDCDGALRALWNLRYLKRVALQVSGVFQYCPFDRKGAVSLQWKVPSYIDCRRLLNPKLINASATQGSLSLSGDDTSFIQVLYRLERPTNAFVRQISGVTRVSQVSGRYLRAFAPAHFDERLFIERNEVSFNTDETGTLAQRLLTTRHYIGPQEALSSWQEEHSSDEIASEDLVLGGTNPRLGIHIHPGINVFMAPLNQSYTGFAWRLEGNILKRVGEPADVTRNVKETPWNTLLFATDNPSGLKFSNFTQAGFEGRPWNDLDFLEAVFVDSDQAQVTIGDKVYVNKGSVPWMVPGVDQVNFVVEGVTVEIPFDQDDAVGEVPTFETGFWAQPRLVIIQRSPVVRDSLRACFTAPVYEGDSPDPLSWTARVIASNAPASQQVQQVGGGVLVSDLTCFNFAVPTFLVDGSLRAGTLKLEVLFSNGRSLSDYVQVCSLIPSGAFELQSSSSSHSSESSQQIAPCKDEFVRRMGNYQFLESDSLGVYADVPEPVFIEGGVIVKRGFGLGAGGCPSFILKPQRSNWDPRWRLSILHVFAIGGAGASGDEFPYLPAIGDINQIGDGYDGYPTGGGYDFDDDLGRGTDWFGRRGFPYPNSAVFFQDPSTNLIYTNWRRGRLPVIYHVTYWPLNLATELQLGPLSYYSAMFLNYNIQDAIPALKVYNNNPLLLGEMYAIWRVFNPPNGPYLIETPVEYGSDSSEDAIRFDGQTTSGVRLKRFIKFVLGFDMENLNVGDNLFARSVVSAVILCNGRPHPILARDVRLNEMSSDERESSGGPGERSSSSSSSQSDASSSSSSQSFECVNLTLAPNSTAYNWMLTDITDPERSTWDPRWLLSVVHRFTLAPTDPSFNPIEWAERITAQPDVYYEYNSAGDYLEVAWYKSFALESGTVQTAALAASRSLFDPQVPPVPQGSPGPAGLYESYPLLDASEADFKSFLLNNLGIDVSDIDLTSGVANLLVGTATEVTFGCPAWLPTLPNGTLFEQTSSSSSFSIPQSESSQSEISSASSSSSLSSASSNSSPSSTSSLSEISSNSSSSLSSPSSLSSLSEVSSNSSSSSSSSSSSTPCANQTLASVASPNGHAFRHDPTTPALVDWHPNWKLSPVFLFKFLASYTNASSVVTSYNWAARVPGSPPTGWAFTISEGELFATWSRQLTVDFSQTDQVAALATVTAMFSRLIGPTSGSDGNGGWTKYEWSSGSSGASRLDFMQNEVGLDMSGLSGTAPGTWFSDVNFPVTLWTSTNRFVC